MSLPTMKTNFSTRKNIYEAAIERRRKFDEDYRNKWNENASYFIKENTKSQLMNKWTSSSIFNNSLNSYLAEGNQDEEHGQILASRKKKLQSLYDAELSQQEYEVMKLRQPENRKTLEQLRKRAEEYHKRNEIERQSVVEQKYDQHFRENDPNIRKFRQDMNLKQTVGTWRNQIDFNQQENRKVHEEELMQNEIEDMQLEREAQLQMELERKKAMQERLRAEELQKQIEELRQSEQAAQLLLAEEEQLLHHQAILEDLDAEKRILDEQRVAKCHGRALLKQHNAALRKKCQEVQRELERDLEWLSRLEHEILDEETTKTEQRKLAQEDLARVKNHIEKDLRLEMARESEIDQLFIQEAKEVWARREREWDRETKAREALLEDVLLQRKHQILNRLTDNRRQQMNDIQDREELLDKLDRMHMNDGDEKEGDNSHDSKNPSARSMIRNQARRDEDIPKNRECSSTKLANDEYKNRLMEQAYERRLRKEAERIRDQAHSSIISGRPTNATFP